METRVSRPFHPASLLGLTPVTSPTSRLSKRCTTQSFHSSYDSQVSVAVSQPKLPLPGHLTSSHRSATLLDELCGM